MADTLPVQIDQMKEGLSLGQVGQRPFEMGYKAPSVMIDLIEGWDAVKADLAARAAAGGGMPLASVKLEAPVQRPGKIWAIGLNYADHIAESNMATPERQVWFTKAVTSINAPYDPIQIARGTITGLTVTTATGQVTTFGATTGNPLDVDPDPSKNGADFFYISESPAAGVGGAAAVHARTYCRGPLTASCDRHQRRPRVGASAMRSTFPPCSAGLSMKP